MKLDGIIAFQLFPVYAGAWQRQTFASFGFRIFNVVKPPSIRQAGARIKGGLGVILDDDLAAFYTLLAMAVCKARFIAGPTAGSPGKPVGMVCFAWTIREYGVVSFATHRFNGDGEAVRRQSVITALQAILMLIEG